MKQSKQILALAAIMAASLALPAPVLAKRTHHRTTPTSGNSNGTKNTNKTPAKQPAPPAVATADQKAAQAADADVQKARAALEAVATRLRQQFESSPDYTAADKEFQRAHDAYEAERSAVLLRHHADPEFAKLLTAKAAADAKITQLRDAGATTELANAAQESLEISKSITSMDTAAMAAEPTLATLHDRLSVAAERRQTLQKNFDQSLTRDSAWTTAKAALDSAQARLNDALQKLRA